jgi:hypothetical protein
MALDSCALLTSDLAGELADAESAVGPAGSTPVTLVLDATGPWETGRAVVPTSGTAFSVHAVNARPANTAQATTHRDALLHLEFAGDMPYGQFPLELEKPVEFAILLFLFRFFNSCEFRRAHQERWASFLSQLLWQCGIAERPCFPPRPNSWHE